MKRLPIAKFQRDITDMVPGSQDLIPTSSCRAVLTV